MKRVIASAGLAALGAASLQAAYTPGLTPPDTTKPWGVSLAVRGFYDDNYVTRPDDLSLDSYGVSINPTARANFSLEQTQVALDYSYDMRWYEDREDNEADHIQLASIRINHAFSDRTKLDISDRFVYAQEGTVLLEGAVVAPVRMDDNDYVRNIGKADFRFGFSEKVGLQLGYRNDISDYEQDGTDSRSALLDRMEHTGSAELHVNVLPDTSALVGYQLVFVDHTSNDDLNVNPGGPPVFLDPDARNQLSHIGYVGVDHTFNPEFEASARAGVQYTDYVNSDDIEDAGGEIDETEVIPYVDVRATWSYNPGSYLQLGVIHTRNQTDMSTALDQTSIAAYANLRHQITGRWSIGLTGFFQNSEFNGGPLDGDSEWLVLAGVSTAYEISPYISAEAGYNYDQLESDIDDRDYDRNRVFVGLRANF